MAVTRQQVAELYVATFNRAPDADGLDYWVNLSGLSIEGIASSFFDQAETQALYPTGTTNSAFVTSIYTNLFARTPDAAGLAYWEAELTSGNMTRSVMIEAMKNGALGADAAIIANKATVGLYYADAGLQGTDFSLDSVTAYQSSVTAAETSVDALAGTASLSLTTGVDTITGTAANEIINATDTTLTALDTIDGGAGTDTLNIVSLGAFTTPASATVTGVETVNVRGASTVSLLSDTWTGTTAANVTQATNAIVVAAATTAVSVSGATGTVAIDGGSTHTVTTAGGNVTLGAAVGAAGAVSVTHTAQAATTIAINGGTDVTVTSTGSTTGAAINIGQAPVAVVSPIPTGDIVVTSTSAAAVDAAADVTMGAINIDGGSTVSVTQATNKGTMATTGVTGATIIQGAVSVDAGNTTTEVTVVQEQTVAETTAVAAVAEVLGTRVITFTDVAGTTGIVVGGLTFTTTGAMTAEEQAAAFANLTAGDNNGSGTDGIYTGTFSTAFTSNSTITTASATTATLTFTEVVGSTGTAALAVTNAATALGVAGVLEVDAIEGVLGVTSGVVAVDDNATKSVTTINLDGYGTATLGAGSSLDALTTLSLANSAATATLTSTSTTLGVTVNNVTGVIALGGNVTTLNITTATEDSASALTAAAVTALTVSGTNALDLTGATLTALTSATVSGTAGLTLAGQVQATLASINTAATTGTVTATIDSTVATYTGGAGNDNVTFSNTTAATKAINLGAGNNSLTLAAGTTALTSEMIAGAGTDTLVMAAADAETASAATTFETKITGFEKLSLGTVAAAADDTVNLANMDDISYVIYANAAAAADTLTLTNMTNNGTVELTAAGLGATVTMTDATSTTADILNVVLTNAATAAFGTVAAAGVETINITSTDSDTTVAAVHTMTLSDAAAKTINVTGNAGLTLTNTDNVALTMLDGSAMTGVLTASTNATVAQTIKGGSAADVLTAATSNLADTLIGNAGNDILNANAGLTTMTGGAGTDTFVIGVASLNSSSYSTITDASAGDLIKFTGADSFAASAVTLGDTAVFQDYANAAMNATGANDVSWFQYAGNTYLVMDEGTTNSTTFINGEDFVVKLTGLVDLSTASFNDTTDTISIY